MAKFDDFIRGFYWYGESWYASSETSFVDEIMVGMFDIEGGGTEGEFAIRWKKVGDQITPRLEAFDDSWLALGEFKDLLQEMGDIDNENISPAEFADLLIDLGIKDLTERKNPHKRLPKVCATCGQKINEPGDYEQ